MITATSTVEEFRQVMIAAGLTPPEPLAPGMNRFPGIGKSKGNKSGWAWLSDDGMGGAFGDWSSDLSQTWQARYSTSAMSDADRDARRQRIAEAQRVRDEEKRRQYAQAAAEAREIWDRTTLAGDNHRYLVTKSVHSHGLRLGEDGRLIVPISINGHLASLQFIAEDGQKRFLTGGQIQAGYFSIGEISNAVVISEGFATGASIHEATDLPVVIALNAGNLLAVARSIRIQYPNIRIVIAGDNDQSGTGQEKAREAAEAVNGIAIIPDTPGDWNDLSLSSGADVVGQAFSQCFPAADGSPPADACAASPTISQEIRLTDLGNAERFAHQHRDRARYCVSEGSWFVYNDQTHLWQAEPGAVVQKAKTTIRAMYDEARAESDDERRTKLAGHAVKTESARRLEAMLRLSASEPGMAISLTDFDRDPWSFSVENGVINLHTGEYRLRRRNDFISKRCSVHFDPNAACPNWLLFLSRIFQGNQQLITYVQQVAGYSLTGITSEQCLFILWGTGSNGKSTLIKVLMRLLGDYAVAVPADTFFNHAQDGRARPDLVRLKGARMTAAVETEAGCRLSESSVKQMTGGDLIVARSLYGNFIQFEPTHKILLATNHKPRIRDNSHAMWRRLKLIPFEVQIPDTEQDRNLGNRLITELPGILNWALEGCRAWQQTGQLLAPDAVSKATATYRTEQDVLDDFLREHCVRASDAIVKFSELRQVYVTWGETTSECLLSAKAFGAALQERGFKPNLIKNARHYRGLRLRTQSDDITDELENKDPDVDLDT